MPTLESAITMLEVNFIITIIFLNISFKAYDFIALHDIEIGAELRWDYATVEYEIGNFPSECLCGAKVKKIKSYLDFSKCLFLVISFKYILNLRLAVHELLVTKMRLKFCRNNMVSTSPIISKALKSGSSPRAPNSKVGSRYTTPGEPRDSSLFMSIML